MKQEPTFKTCSQTTRVNRYDYGFYMVLVIYLAIKGNYDWAITNLGVALVFDPFETTVKWQHRPLYQRAWLLTHVAIMLAGLLFLWFQKH